MSSKKFEPIETDGFYRDEDGNWHIRPLKMPGCVKPSANKSNEKMRRRKYIPIEPLKLPKPEDLEEPEVKKRKSIKPVRKELFKVPQKTYKKDIPLKSYRPRNFPTTRNSYNKITMPKLVINDSPLLDLNEAGGQLPRAVLLTPDQNGSESQNQTPKSNESEQEFLQIEKALATLNGTNKAKSPMSSVCALLENAKINNSDGRITKKPTTTVLTEIRSLIEHDKENFSQLMCNINKYAKSREEDYTKIQNLLAQLDEHENVENTTRKSIRIATRTVITEECKKYVKSPTISQNADLRKSTLKKNLSKTLQAGVQSPKMKKALTVYNSLRDNCEVLVTPKLDRTAINQQQGSVTRSLSTRILKQCLLLQDTPQH